MSARKRLSAAGRVTVAVVAVLALGVVLVSAIAYDMVTRAMRADLDKALLGEVEAYAAAVGLEHTTDDRTLAEASRAYLAERSSGSGSLATVLLVSFADGSVISNSDLRLEDAPDNEALLDPKHSVAGFDTIEFEGQTYRVATAPVSSVDSSQAAVFQAAANTAALVRLQRDLALGLGSAGLLAVLVGAVIAAFAARRSLAPLSAMASDAAGISSADLTKRIEYAGPSDELGVLAETLNAMLDDLESAFSAQKRFVADASHELRTPIAVVRGNLDLLKHPATGEAERAEALAVIEDEIMRMTRMLEDLLALARLEGGLRRPFQALDAGILVAEVAARARALGDAEVVASCTGSAWVEGDPDLLEQALVNLVRNAIEHGAAGDAEAPVELACEPQDNTVVITVADRGPGIPAADAERLFDRFYRSGERASGSGGAGLGLAISAELVRLHRGSISAANRPEGGAVFTVRLPRIEPPE